MSKFHLLEQAIQLEERARIRESCDDGYVGWQLRQEAKRLRHEAAKLSG